MFKNLFSFEGRIRRTEYGISLIVYYLSSFLLDYIVADNPDYGIIYFLYIPILWILFAQGAKRCHDVGRRGWYQLIPFYIFVLLFSEGHFGPNEYGINPKGLGNVDEIDEIGNYLPQ